MSFEIKTGNDGREYAVFASELDVEEYCNIVCIDPQIHCVGGYMNAILLDDVATE